MKQRTRGRKLLALTLVSAALTFMSIWGVGCSAPPDSSRAAAETDESCEAEVRNDEWDVDCSAACNHVMACKTSGDSNLETLTCGDCLGSCLAGVSLGGNDLVEGTEEDRRSWQCAELVEGCSALDHNCDLY